MIQGARITATNLNTNMAQETTSDVSGQYRILALPAGPYKVEASFSGFQTFVSTGIVLTVDERRRVDIELKVGTTEQVATVVATAVQVETTNTQLGDVIENKKILDLPLTAAATSICSDCSPAWRPPARAMKARVRFPLTGSERTATASW